MDEAALPLAFLSPVSGKSVMARFDGGLLSSDAGVLVLREIETRLGLSGRLAGCLDDPRNPDLIQHGLADMIRFRMMMIAAGYEDGNDAAHLRSDPVFKMAQGVLPSDRHLASQPTISRLENLADVRSLLRMGRAMIDLYCASFRKVNARAAMPEGGRLTIETQNAHLDSRYAAAHLGVPAGQYVLIAVTDTGSGMPADVIAKAFDPFFTTKEIGKGTGLGLSQVYGFVKQTGGHVIYSEPGQGTTVKIYLPRLMSGAGEAAEDEMPPEMPLGERDEVVLVVEDEPAVRQFSVDTLSELDYRVLEADGAVAALRLLDAHAEIALLFTDIVMPDVNGRKLADEALRRRPDLKVLFTPGYTRNAVVHNDVLDIGVELIGKPFTIDELAAKVRDVLDAPAVDVPG